MQFCAGYISGHAYKMIESLIVLGIRWSFSAREGGVDLHCHQGGIDHHVFCGSRVYIHPLDLKDRICGIEVLILDLTFGIAVHGIGKISIKFFNVKMIGASADFLIRSKSDGDRTVWDLFCQYSFCHSHDLCNSGFVIRSQNRISIAGDQSTTFEIL